MADRAAKKAAFVSRYIQAVVQLLDDVNKLANLKEEWTANAYPTGGTPAENNIVQSDLLGPAPHMTVLQLNQAVGAVEAVRTTVAAQIGYLEAVRP